MRLLRFVGAVIMTVVSGGVFAQSEAGFPNKVIRVLVGTSDALPRVLAQGLGSRIGQQVIVDNRGAGLLAIDVAVKAAPDGYTYLLFGNSLWLSPLMQPTTYDPARDLMPVSLATIAPAVLVVHPSVTAKSVKELISLAKSKPGSLNYGSGGAGSTSHLSGELLRSMAGIDIVRVPYKGTIQAATGTAAGEVQIFFATLGAVGPMIKAGRLRPLAVTTARPTALAPDLPAMAEFLSGYEMNQIQGIFTPAKTPVSLVNRMQQEVAAVVTQADVKEQFLALGTEAVGGSAEALAQAIKADIGRLGKVIKDGGIKLE